MALSASIKPSLFKVNRAKSEPGYSRPPVNNHYTATLSDAAGPVTGLTNGSRLLLEYRVKGPLILHQTLKLMPDGKTIDNVGKITFLGITVGHLHETITRKD